MSIFYLPLLLFVMSVFTASWKGAISSFDSTLQIKECWVYSLLSFLLTPSLLWFSLISCAGPGMSSRTQHSGSFPTIPHHINLPIYYFSHGHLYIIFYLIEWCVKVFSGTEILGFISAQYDLRSTQEMKVSPAQESRTCFNCFTEDSQWQWSFNSTSRSEEGVFRRVLLLCFCCREIDPACKLESC